MVRSRLVQTKVELAKPVSHFKKALVSCTMNSKGNKTVGPGGRQSGANSGLNLGQYMSTVYQRISTLESENRAVTDENGRLKAIVQELEGQNNEWRENYPTVERIIANLRDQLDSKNQEIQRLAPYGSYCVSGANPYFLNKSVQRVSHALNGFVLSMRIPAGKPSTDIADLSRDEALVSSIFFSKFERVDFGVEDEATFTPPAQLPELSFQEYKAFDVFMEDQEDCRNKATVEPYVRKFNAFHRLVAREMDNQFPLGQIEANDERLVRFFNLTTHVWMLHKLTLSFDKENVRVMRVGCGEEFNKEFMQTVPGRQDEEEHKLGTPPPVVRNLILPGLWINGSVFKCHVFLGSPAHQEINCTSEPSNQAGAMNGTDQPQEMDNDVEAFASEEHPAIATECTSPLHPFVLCGTVPTYLWRKILSYFQSLSPLHPFLLFGRVPISLWRTILLHSQSLSRGHICEAMERQPLNSCRPLKRDHNSSLEEPPEFEPQPECNQLGSLVSERVNCAGSEQHVAAETSHPPCPKQAVNNDTAASSDGTVTPGVCKSTEDLQIVVEKDMANLKISLPPEAEIPAAAHSSTVRGIGFTVETEKF